MFFLYYFFYGTSFAKVPWVYNSEINSLAWRTRGAAAATATNWMGGFIVTQFTKVGVNNLHWRFYLSMFISLPSPLNLMQQMLIRGGVSVCDYCMGLFPRCFLLLPRDIATHARRYG